MIGPWPIQKMRPTDAHTELHACVALRRQLPDYLPTSHPLRKRTIFPDIPATFDTPQHDRHEAISGR